MALHYPQPTEWGSNSKAWNAWSPTESDNLEGTARQGLAVHEDTRSKLSIHFKLFYTISPTHMYSRQTDPECIGNSCKSIRKTK